MGVERKRNSSRRHADEREEVRLAVNLPMTVHRRVKAKAAEQGVTIRDFILDLLRRAGV